MEFTLLWSEWPKLFEVNLFCTQNSQNSLEFWLFCSECNWAYNIALLQCRQFASVCNVLIKHVSLKPIFENPAQYQHNYEDVSEFVILATNSFCCVDVLW